MSTCEEAWARHEALEQRLGLSGAPGVPAGVEQRAAQMSGCFDPQPGSPAWQRGERPWTYMGTPPIVARRLPRIPFGLGTGALAGGVMGAVTGSARPWWWFLGGAVLGGGCSVWNAYAEYRESQIIIEQGGVALPPRQ